MIGLGLNSFINQSYSCKTIKILSNDNTYIYSLATDTNYNDDTKLWLYYGDENDIMYVLLDFDLSSIFDKTIVSAKIILNRKLTTAPIFKSEIKYIKDSWNKENVTWNTKPEFDTLGYDNHLHTGITEVWDVTTLVQLIAIGAIEDYNGFAIIPTEINYPGDEFFKDTTLEIKILR